MTQADIRALLSDKITKAGIQLEIDEYDRRLLAKSGPAIYLCNHLLPGLDTWLLLSILSEYDKDLRLLHPYPTPPPKDLDFLAIRSKNGALDPGIFQVNIAKTLIKEVGRGRSLALVVDFSENPIGHGGKNLLRAQILQQLRKARQPIIPIHFIPERQNGWAARRNLLGISLPFGIEPAKGNSQNDQKATPGSQTDHQPNSPAVRIHVRVGQAITPGDIALFERSKPWQKFIQAKIFSLGSNFNPEPEQFTTAQPLQEVPLAEVCDPALVAADIAALKPECKVTSRGAFDVFIAPFIALPNAMMEIGRLRELTFRSVGEGSGKARDLDEHDLYYLQLIIWDREQQRIVGGYRIGQGDIIFKRFGINGLYVNSLFKIKPGFYPVIQQAVELGRSYIIPDYQRHRLPLFLLWKGILHFLLANPQYKYLYGPVSISKVYSEVSKSVIVEFVKRFYFDATMAALVKPRKEFRLRSRSIDTGLLAENLRGEFEALEQFVEDAEPDHFKIPVLFRQYLKQNAKFIAFNVDPGFSDCLDGLMLLDISLLPDSTLEVLQS